MNRLFIRTCLASICTICLSINLFAQYTKIHYLTGTGCEDAVPWDFFCTKGAKSGEWTSIPVPSHWELQGFGSYNYGHVEEADRVRESGIYKREFDVPAGWKGKKVNIVFEGVMTDTEVEINGKKAGEMHQGGFYRFKYDITGLLKYGRTNTIKVNVAKYSSNESVNKAERHADFWVFGGIYRPVYLEVLPETHIAHLAVDPRADGLITVQVDINNLKSNAVLMGVITDTDGHPVGQEIRTMLSEGTQKADLKGIIEDISQWTPEFPNLYNLNLSLISDGKVLHAIKERIGFRTVEFKARDGIYVNGVKVILKGVNRHTFRPETGRCTDKRISIEDVLLIKEMNMNAVRMSHYPPDKHFLEVCDSLGLFVLDELTGWQDAYDSVVGEKLVKEMIRRDINHPSIIIWDNGNEGGWNYSLDRWFDELDPQKRPVVHPWEDFRGINTRHYPNFEEIGQQVAFSKSLIMPTEILHGLFDGGHGAGLEDYWRMLNTSPLFAGMFLWVFADEAVVRLDMQGKLDSDGDHAPDGIVGPHHEKEGSFYTIKEIWSPVQFPQKYITDKFTGVLEIENHYLYTNLDRCRFEWSYVKLPGPYEGNEEVLASGTVKSLNINPGSRGTLEIGNPDNVKDSDLLRIRSIDPYGEELFTNTWILRNPQDIATDIIRNIDNTGEIEIELKNDTYFVRTHNVEVGFDTKSGNLTSVKNNLGQVSFSGGASFAGCSAGFQEMNVEANEEGVIIKVRFNRDTRIKWTILRNGLIRYEASYRPDGNQKNMGVNFYYPEENITSLKWFGKGPYRVWKNRIKGSSYGVWYKDYNDTRTGESYENLIYPEFKGYHANLYWAIIGTKEAPLRVICESEDIFLRVMTPDKHQISDREGLRFHFPEGDISFLHGISAIGTKFKNAEQLGPMSLPDPYRYHSDGLKKIVLWFDFR